MKSQYVLPASIVIVGALIAGAVFLVSRGPGPQNPGGASAATRPVDATDHILGNPNAPVIVIEYADLECPFCKEFQKTSNQLMEYYGPSGKVAWVYRHFPLIQIHRNASEEAQASECAAAQGGSAAFFKYIDRLYSITPGEDGLDLAQLPNIAADIGLDGQKLAQCLAANTYAEKIQKDYAQAIAEGIQGTPHLVIMTSAGPVLTLDGNQPYSSMRAAIDQVLSALGESASATTTAQ